MSLILDGTNGLSDVDGTAAAPAIRGTDTNTGIFFPAADTIAFAEGGTEAMRLDSSGNLVVGVATTGSTGITLNTAYNLGWLQGAGESLPNIFRQSSSAATILANGYRYSATANSFASSYSPSWAKAAIAVQDGTVRFYTDTATTVAAGTDVTPTERMRIDSSGNLLVGTTSAPNSAANPKLTVAASGTDWVSQFKSGYTTGSGRTVIGFYDGSNDFTGQISIDAGANTTSYQTSSDYRLKEDIAPMTGALDKVAQLKPVTYKWKSNGSDAQGFIAHELKEIFPEAVGGEKDAVDAEGKPVYQGIDTSFLVATLTAAIQELKTELDSVKAELQALKGAA